MAEDNTAGPAFNARGGGVYAMQWDGSGIQICKYPNGGEVSPMIDISPSYHRQGYSVAKRYQVMFTHGSPDRYRGEPPMPHFRRADVTLTVSASNEGRRCNWLTDDLLTKSTFSTCKSSSVGKGLFSYRDVLAPTKTDLRSSVAPPRSIDISICGDWAGTPASGFASGCYDDCATYVRSPRK